MKSLCHIVIIGAFLATAGRSVGSSTSTEASNATAEVSSAAMDPTTSTVESIATAEVSPTTKEDPSISTTLSNATAEVSPTAMDSTNSAVGSNAMAEVSPTTMDPTNSTVGSNATAEVSPTAMDPATSTVESIATAEVSPTTKEDPSISTTLSNATAEVSPTAMDPANSAVGSNAMAEVSPTTMDPTNSTVGSNATAEVSPTAMDPATSTVESNATAEVSPTTKDPSISTTPSNATAEVSPTAMNPTNSTMGSNATAEASPTAMDPTNSTVESIATAEMSPTTKDPAISTTPSNATAEVSPTAMDPTNSTVGSNATAEVSPTAMDPATSTVESISTAEISPIAMDPTTSTVESNATAEVSPTTKDPAISTTPSNATAEVSPTAMDPTNSAVGTNATAEVSPTAMDPTNSTVGSNATAEVSPTAMNPTNSTMGSNATAEASPIAMDPTNSTVESIATAEISPTTKDPAISTTPSNATAEVSPTAMDPTNSAVGTNATAEVSPTAMDPTNSTVGSNATAEVSPTAMNPTNSTMGSNATAEASPTAMDPTNSTVESIATAEISPTTKDPAISTTPSNATVEVSPTAMDPTNSTVGPNGTAEVSPTAMDPATSTVESIATAEISPTAMDPITSTAESNATAEVSPTTNDPAISTTPSNATEEVSPTAMDPTNFTVGSNATAEVSPTAMDPTNSTVGSNATAEVSPTAMNPTNSTVESNATAEVSPTAMDPTTSTVESNATAEVSPTFSTGESNATAEVSPTATDPTNSTVKSNACAEVSSTAMDPTTSTVESNATAEVSPTATDPTNSTVESNGCAEVSPTAMNPTTSTVESNATAEVTPTAMDLTTSTVESDATAEVSPTFSTGESNATAEVSPTATDPTNSTVESNASAEISPTAMDPTSSTVESNATAEVSPTFSTGKSNATAEVSPTATDPTNSTVESNATAEVSPTAMNPTTSTVESNATAEVSPTTMNPTISTAESNATAEVSPTAMDPTNFTVESNATVEVTPTAMDPTTSTVESNATAEVSPTFSTGESNATTVVSPTAKNPNISNVKSNDTAEVSPTAMDPTFSTVESNATAEISPTTMDPTNFTVEPNATAGVTPTAMNPINSTMESNATAGVSTTAMNPNISSVELNSTVEVTPTAINPTISNVESNATAEVTPTAMDQTISSAGSTATVEISPTIMNPINSTMESNATGDVSLTTMKSIISTMESNATAEVSPTTMNLFKSTVESNAAIEESTTTVESNVTVEISTATLDPINLNTESNAIVKVSTTVGQTTSIDDIKDTVSTAKMNPTSTETGISHSTMESFSTLMGPTTSNTSVSTTIMNSSSATVEPNTTDINSSTATVGPTTTNTEVPATTVELITTAIDSSPTTVKPSTTNTKGPMTPMESSTITGEPTTTIMDLSTATAGPTTSNTEIPFTITNSSATTADQTTFTMDSSTTIVTKSTTIIEPSTTNFPTTNPNPDSNTTVQISTLALDSTTIIKPTNTAAESTSSIELSITTMEPTSTTVESTAFSDGLSQEKPMSWVQYMEQYPSAIGQAEYDQRLERLRRAIDGSGEEETTTQAEGSGTETTTAPELVTDTTTSTNTSAEDRLIDSNETITTTMITPDPTTTEVSPDTTIAGADPTTIVEEPTTAGADPTTIVEEPTTAAVEPTTIMLEPTTAAADPTTNMVDTTIVGADPTTIVAESTTAAVNPTTNMVNTTIAGADPTTIVAEPTTAAVDPTTNIVDTTIAGADPTTIVEEPTTAGADPTTIVEEPTTAAVEPTTIMLEPTTAAVDPTTNIVDTTIAGADPTTIVAEPTTAAKEPTTNMLEPTTAAVDPTTNIVDTTIAGADPTTIVAEPITTAAVEPTTNMPKPTIAATDPITVTDEPTTPAVDPCLSPATHNCDSNAECDNSLGSYTCICNEGYSGNGIECSDIDECENDHGCDGNAKCNNTIGNFTCTCNSGYEGNGILCTDIDECKSEILNNCDSNSRCENDEGSFSCFCNVGYTGDGVNCADINECDVDPFLCDENADCVDIEGSFKCSCKTGFSGDDSTCNDIDECKSEIDNCDSNSRCENDEGSFSCFCNVGYTGDGVNCTNINECEGDPFPCDENADCQDTEGSFECSCLKGFSGDGSTCTDIDECALNFDDCSPEPRGKCTNFAGAWNCSCLDGHAGNGKNCQEIETIELNLIAATTDGVRVEIVSKRRHQIYEFQVRRIDNDFTRKSNYTGASTSLVVRESGLEDGTEYEISARVVRLQNGYDVSPEFSGFTRFETELEKVPANFRSTQSFLPVYNDINSPASIALSLTFIEVILSGNAFIVRITIISFSAGSVIALMETETNKTSNKTLDDVRLSNSSFSITEVPAFDAPPPGNATVKNITTNSFVICYDPYPNATQYQIRGCKVTRNGDSQFNTTTINLITSMQYVGSNDSVVVTNETSFKVTGLPQNTAIIAAVRAIIKSDSLVRFSNYTKDFEFTTKAEGPKNLEITVLTGDSITITFDAVRTAETYNVSFQNFSSLDFTLTADQEAGGKLSKQLDGLTADTKYDVEVLAVIGEQTSEKSLLSATTGPKTVSSVAVYNVSADGFNVEFDPVNIVPAINTSYVINYETSTNNMDMETSDTDQFISATDPTENEYNVSVTYKTTKLSTTSDQVSTKIWAFGDVTETSIAITWDQYKSASAYNISISPGSDQPEQSAISATLSGLSGGVEHTIAVSMGDKTLFTVNQLTCPPMVSNLRCETKSFECITLKWDASLSATSYVASVTENKFAQVNTDFANNMSEICNLTSGDIYSANVVAVNSECDSVVTNVSNCKTDVDECASASDNNCADDANCTNTLSSFTCACKMGFTGDGVNCTDILECDDTTTCHKDAVCLELPGSYNCTCNEGFSGDGKTCEDDDECAKPEDNNCHENANCTNMPGNYTCECKSGFEGDGENCTDIDECKSTPCDTNANCTNDEGTFFCTCNDGFEKNGTRCEDIDECTLKPCAKQNSVCNNTDGNYTCSCEAGFAGDPFTSCQELEKLSPPLLVSCQVYKATFQITSTIPHKEYEVKLYDNSGNERQVMTVTETTFEFVDLTQATDYSVTIRILILENGGVGVAPESERQSFTTKTPLIQVLLSFSDLVFSTALNDRSSSEFEDITNTFKSRFDGTFPGFANVLEILQYFDGSVTGLIEIDKNPDSNLTIANATITNGTIAEVVTSSVAGPTPTSDNIRSDGFTVAWPTVTDATQYVVQVDCTTISFSEAYYVSVNSTQVTGVQPNTPCTVFVRGIVNMTATLNSPSITVTTLASGPKIFAQAMGSSEIRIVLDAIPGATLYTVIWDSGSNSNLTKGVNDIIDNKITFDIYNLEVDQEYFIFASATIGGQQSVNSTETVRTGMSDVQDIYVFNVTSNGFSVFWSETNLTGNPPVSYVVKYTRGNTTGTAETTSTNIFIPQNTEEGHYQVFIAYKTEIALSAFDTNYTTEIYTVESATANTIEVSWDYIQHSGTFASFIAEAGSDFKDIKNLPDKSRIFENLTPGIRHTIKVTIYNTDIGSVDYFEFTTFTVSGPVKNLECMPTSPTCFTLNWDAEELETFRVTIKPNPPGLTIIVNDTDNSATVCKVTTGNYHNASVFATNSAGEGVSADITNCFSTLPAPTSVSISVDNQTCFSVSWSAGSALSYTVKLTSTTVPPHTVMDTATNSSKQLCGLELATVYFAEVNATYEAGDSAFSTENVSQITAPQTPVLEFVSAETTSITLSWEAVSTTVTYYIKTTQFDPTTTAADIYQATDDTNLTISDLQPGFSYVFAALAENDGGNSTDSADLKQITVPGVVQDFTVDKANVAQLLVPFTWSAVTGAASYDISWAQGNSELGMAPDSTTPWSGITNLADGESYNISIFAISKSVGEVQQGEAVTIEFITAPPTPVNITVSEIGRRTLTITWNESKGAVTYEFEMQQIFPNGTNGRNYTFSKNQLVARYHTLSAGHVYVITLRAENEGGFSLAKSVEQITEPDAVPNLAVRRFVAQNSFRLTWDAVDGAATYNVMITSTNGANFTKKASVSLIDFEASDGVTAGQNYTASVTALTSTVNGLQQTSEATTLNFQTAPSDPSTISEVSSTTSSLTFSWIASDGTDMYQVTVKNSTSSILQQFNVTTNTATVSNLDDGNTYTIEIIAFNEFGASDAISGELTTKPNVPDFTAVEVTTNSIKLQWPAVKSAILYTIRVKRTSDSVVIPLSESTLRKTEIEIPGLASGTNYTITMQTFTIEKSSDKISKTQITVSDAPSLTLTSRTTNSLAFSWDPIRGADNYLVEYKVASASSSSNETVTTNSVAIPNLQADTQYSITISSVNSAGSNPTVVQYYTVISTGPMVTITDITSNSFIVKFDAVPESMNYEVQLTPAGTTPITSTSNSVTVPDLNAATEYAVVVFVNYKITGKSAGSTSVKKTTLTETPTNFMVESNTQTEGITLTWTKVNGAAKYQIISTLEDGTTSDPLSFDNPPALVPTILGSTYNFTLQVVNDIDLLSEPIMLNLQTAANPQEFILEITLESTYVFSNNLKDVTSIEYKNLEKIVVDDLTVIWANVDGFQDVTLVSFLQGSVVARVDVKTTSPSVTTAKVVTEYINSTADKTTFTGDVTSNLNECINEVSPCHEQATCANTDASYECTCKSGFIGNGKSCEDDDECATGICGDNASCENTPQGSYACTCNDGYSGTPCKNIDECQDTTTCKGSSVCVDNIGSFECTCSPGFVYSGTDCVDIIECGNDTICHVQASCTDAAGSFFCTCFSGYTGNGTWCDNINECETTMVDCKANETCVDNEGSYKCLCKEGYMENADSVCVDKDECLQIPRICHASASCNNSIGSYICVCDPGFTGDGANCANINECVDTEICPKNQTCVDTSPEYYCTCSSGFSGDISTSCIDINECEDPNRCPHGKCMNTIGSFRCDCDSGFDLILGKCEDIDECANPNKCIPEARCENGNGTFECVCIDGYTGDNNVCTDIDECLNTSICELKNSVCDNGPGNYACVCVTGFIKQDDMCVNFDDCVDNNCQAGSVCVDGIGDFTCDCRDSGFQGENCGTDIDECTTNTDNCDTNADCRNTVGSYECTCMQYFTGDGQNCTGNITDLYVIQVITKYEFSESLGARATIPKADLLIEVQKQVILQFPGFTFVSVTFTSGNGTAIIATYIIRTAMPIDQPLMAFFVSGVGDQTLFATSPQLDVACGTDTCSSGRYCRTVNKVNKCLCIFGYTDNGNETGECFDIDECNRGICDMEAECENMDGSFTCTCNSGYEGTGIICADIDECDKGTSVCTANSQCNNTVGSFSCDCNPGFKASENGTSCIGQCEDFGCNNGGTCIPSLESRTPTCSCTSQFTGPTCNDSSIYRNLAIGFGVVGGILLILVIAGIVVFMYRRKRAGTDFVP